MNTCNFVDYLDSDLHLDLYQLHHTPIIRNMSWGVYFFVIPSHYSFVRPSVRSFVCELYIKVLSPLIAHMFVTQFQILITYS